MTTRCARLRCAGDRHGPIHADPLRPASLRWRSSWTYSCRPAAPSFAALAIVMDLFMPTRCAQLRCAGDRHGPIHADPLRPASLRWRSSWAYSCRPAAPSFAALAIVMGLILLGVPTVRWPKRKFAPLEVVRLLTPTRQRPEPHPAVCACHSRPRCRRSVTYLSISAGTGGRTRRAVQYDVRIAALACRSNLADG